MNNKIETKLNVNDMSSIDFEYNSQSFKILYSQGTHDYWVSIFDLSTLFKREFSFMWRMANAALECDQIEIEKVKNTFAGINEICIKTRPTLAKLANVQTEGKRQVRRLVSYYNLIVVLILAAKLNYNAGIAIIQCIINHTNYLSDNNKVIIYQGNNFSINVKISPEEETVWLTQNQIATLFETTKNNVSIHIKNILEENELSRATVKDFLTVQNEQGRHVNRYISYYNLDMILAVGYRIKSNRAIEFRKWVTTILKRYLIKGYSINDDRIATVEQSHILLVKKVIEIENKISNIETKIDESFHKHILFYKGQSYDAYSYLAGKIESAKHSIIYIDPYADRFNLSVLSCKNPNVKALLIGSKVSNITEEEIEIINRSNGNISFIKDNDNHDRYLIIDNNVCYEIGTSTNSFGYYNFHITRNDDKDFIQKLLCKYEKTAI